MESQTQADRSVETRKNLHWRNICGLIVRQRIDWTGGAIAAVTSLVHPIMNYDSWKLASGVSHDAEALDDRCSAIEAVVDSTLAVAADRTNHPADAQWNVEPALAEPTPDGEISLEVTLRLRHLPVSGQPRDLQELAQAILNLGESLATLARDQQAAQVRFVS